MPVLPVPPQVADDGLEGTGCHGARRQAGQNPYVGGLPQVGPVRPGKRVAPETGVDLAAAAPPPAMKEHRDRQHEGADQKRQSKAARDMRGGHSDDPGGGEYDVSTANQQARTSGRVQPRLAHGERNRSSCHPGQGDQREGDVLTHRRESEIAAVTVAMRCLLRWGRAHRVAPGVPFGWERSPDFGSGRVSPGESKMPPRRRVRRSS